MAKPKQARWKCPHCGDGCLAPTRPRKDDVRRYCLRCSERTGRLVERVAPSLERRRQERTEASRERAAAKRAKAKAEADDLYVVGSLDLRKELKRLCRLEAFTMEAPSMATSPPRMRVVRRHVQPQRHGRAFGSREIEVVRFPGQTEQQAREILVHELAHVCVWRSRPGEPAHGRYWKSIFRSASKEAYGVVPMMSDRFVGKYAAAEGLKP